MNTRLNPHESTYWLLVRSEEKGRTAIELIGYALFIWSVVFSIWQFAQQPITLPTSIGGGSPNVATSAAAQTCAAKS